MAGKNRVRNERGYTLIELLIATSISSVAMLATAAAFGVLTQANSRQQDAIDRDEIAQWLDRSMASAPAMMQTLGSSLASTATNSQLIRCLKNRDYADLGCSHSQAFGMSIFDSTGNALSSPDSETLADLGETAPPAAGPSAQYDVHGSRCNVGAACVLELKTYAVAYCSPFSRQGGDSCYRAEFVTVFFRLSLTAAAQRSGKASFAEMRSMVVLNTRDLGYL